MRDIRDDLNERLKAVDAQHASALQNFDERRLALETELRATLADLTRERDALTALLAAENRKMTGSEVTMPAPRTLMPLSDFLITKAAAYGSVDKDQLKAEADAAGYPEAKNGRQFHFVLMNITKAHKLHRLPDGRYAHPNPSPALAGLFSSPQTEEEATRTLM